jgi:hypothetical protein
MTSCQVSENPKTGPLTAHTATTTTARRNVTGRPVSWAAPFAMRSKPERVAATERIPEELFMPEL